MPLFPVSTAKQQALEAAMLRLGILESDLKETFIRSGGPGGQNVNKVSTCVVLVHRPSGTTIKCQRERSQAMNRFLARRLLADKLEAQILGKASEEARRISKLRRQKAKRSKRAKQKILEAKHKQGEKKALRRRLDSEGD